MNFFQESVSKIFKVYSQQNYSPSHSFVKLAYVLMVVEKAWADFKNMSPHGKSPRISYKSFDWWSSDDVFIIHM